MEEAIADGRLTNEERLNILWLCEKLRSTDFFNTATADMQRLHGLMAGIVGDGSINETELHGLSLWLAEREHLRTCWPYDEVDSLITSVLRDGRIDESERTQLHDFFGEFVAWLITERSLARSLFKVDLFLDYALYVPR